VLLFLGVSSTALELTSVYKMTANSMCRGIFYLNETALLIGCGEDKKGGINFYTHNFTHLTY
jgi:hypothetical protein